MSRTKNRSVSKKINPLYEVRPAQPGSYGDMVAEREQALTGGRRKAKPGVCIVEVFKLTPETGKEE